MLIQDYNHRRGKDSSMHKKKLNAKILNLIRPLSLESQENLND